MVSDRKSTRLNSSHTEIYTLSLHDALPIYVERQADRRRGSCLSTGQPELIDTVAGAEAIHGDGVRSEEHTSELQSHRDLHSFPTRRSSDLRRAAGGSPARKLLVHRAARTDRYRRGRGSDTRRWC